MHLTIHKNACKSAWILIVLVLAGCSKDTPEISRYQLEGTWQLYKTYTGQIDSVYERSPDNQIIFTPKFYRSYSDGMPADSGSYRLTDVLVKKNYVSATIHFDAPVPISLYLYGDTLVLSPPGVIANGNIYIRSAPSMQDAPPVR